MSTIAVFGAGYAGLVTGACFAELGHDVRIRDVVPERIDALRTGRVPFYEPGLEELVSRNRSRLTFTTAVGEAVDGAECIFVCVGTPPTYAGDADLSAVWSVIDSLPPLRPGSVLVMKSTVPVGTGEKVRAALDARGLADVGYASCPEFLSEGTALDDFLRPDRVVIGAWDDAAANAVEGLHVKIDAPVARMDVASAEMVKLAANAFLAMRISFINEIANVCELVGADVEAVAHGMGLDSRIGKRYLRAGLGYGGSCYPKDTSFLKLLAGNSGYTFQLVNAVIQVNELQMRRPVAKLLRHLGKLRGKRVAILGLAFKPGTDDLREAPSIVLASRLLAEGAEVVAWDPVADAGEILHGVEFAPTAVEALRGADAAVIVTEWPELLDLSWKDVQPLMRNALVVDGRNHLDPAEMRASGFAYEGVGRAASPFATLPETPEPEHELHP